MYIIRSLHLTTETLELSSSGAGKTRIHGWPPVNTYKMFWDTATPICLHIAHETVVQCLTQPNDSALRHVFFHAVAAE